MKASNPYSRQAKDARVFENSKARVINASTKKFIASHDPITRKPIASRALNDDDAKMMVVRACR